MEFILQLLADLLLPVDEKETVVSEEVTADANQDGEAAMVAPIVHEEKLEGENIFGLMEFH
jgi:hypothetical protein